MDQKDIENTTKNVRRFFDHDAAKQTLKEKYETKMLFTAFGGMWRAGPDLLSTLHMFDPNGIPNAVLLDEYGNPCNVEVARLFAEGSERWQEQMNAWHIEFEELQKQR